MKIFSFAIAFLFISFSSNAQSLANVDGNAISIDKTISFNLDDWSIFHNQEDNLFYIDLATVEANLSDIKVSDANGTLIFKDNLYDLPVDAIYELDLSNFSTGDYEVEIRTFKESVFRSVSVK